MCIASLGMNEHECATQAFRLVQAGAQQHSWKLLNNEYQAPSVTITSFNHWKYTATNEHYYPGIPITLFLCVFNVHIMTHS